MNVTDAGVYVCNGSNSEGSAKKIYNVMVYCKTISFTFITHIIHVFLSCHYLLIFI